MLGRRYRIVWRRGRVICKKNNLSLIDMGGSCREEGGGGGDGADG